MHQKKVVRIKPWLASQATGPLVNYPLSWGDGADNGAVLQEPWRTSNTLVGWSQTCQKRVKLYISTICLNPLHVLYIYIQMLCCQSGFPTCPCASFSKQSHKATLQEQNCSCASSIFQAPGCETSNGHVRLQGSNSWAATRTWRPFSWSLDLKKLMDLSELSPPWWVSCDLGQSQVTADPSAKKTCWTPSPADDPRAITCGSPQLTTWSPQQCQSLSCRDLCLSNSCDRS